MPVSFHIPTQTTNTYKLFAESNHNYLLNQIIISSLLTLSSFSPPVLHSPLSPHINNLTHSPLLPISLSSTQSNSQNKPNMAISLLYSLFFLVTISSVSACDRCVHQSKAAHFYDSAPLSSGACGYKSLALGFNGGFLAGGVPSLLRNGVGCGACFQIRCKNKALCSTAGTKVILTDLHRSNETDFVLSNKAFMAMAQKGKSQDVLKLGVVHVEYKRIPCDYKKQNLAVSVEESSQKPHYLAIKFLYQGGQTDIVGVDVAQVGSSSWSSLSRNYGAVWDTSRVPSGPLQFRLIVTGGYDRKWIWAPKVLPVDWKSGMIYDAGVQITDIAQEGCPTCDDQVWK